MQRKENVNDTLKAVLQKHWAMLIQAVRQLAQAVGNRPPESEEVAAFFHDFMDGYWDVFEEATAHSKEELKQADRQSQMLQDQILRQLGSDHRELLDKYETLLYNATSTELEAGVPGGVSNRDPVPAHGDFTSACLFSRQRWR